MAKVTTYPTFREIAPELPETIRSVIVGDWLADVQHRITEVGLFGSFASPYSEVGTDSDVDVLLVLADWDGEYILSVGPKVLSDRQAEVVNRTFMMVGQLRVAECANEVNSVSLDSDLETALRKCITERGIEVAGERRVVDFAVASPEQADTHHRDSSLQSYVPIWRLDEVDADV